MSSELDRFVSMRVLVVDDHEENLVFVQDILRSAGMHDVVLECDARRVESLLPEVDPDLVLLDLHMPHMHGLQVLSQIVRFARGTYLPVLVLTADATRQAREQALGQGARDFLTKPLDVTEVTLRVANLLETRQLYKDLRIDAAEGRAAGNASSRARIEEALRARAVRVALQPVVDLQTHQVVGYEALARFSMPHPRGTAGWFADAEESGLGLELERLAADAAVAELSYIRSDCFLAVNLSPASVLQLPDAALTSPDAFSRIVVELTEHVPVQDYLGVQRALGTMREAGCRLAADDLGAGYAGFRHLIALEPDVIKLDISLISQIHLSRPKRALAAALQAFAQDMGTTVIGEGIEEPEELQVLADLGVAWGQGYHLGRPEFPAAH